MIDLIIWSKDRACQLDTLLTSIQQFLPGYFRSTAICCGSNDRFLEGYRRLEASHKNVTFRQESTFENDTRAVLFSANTGFVCFSTDDTMVFKSPKFPLDIKSEFTPEVGVFSFRLGLNTVVQNPFTGQRQPPLRNYSYSPNTDVLSWRFADYHPDLNYAYLMSMDMHVFRRSDLLKLMDFPFKSTNQLEGGLYYRTHLMPPKIKSFSHSLAVNIPANNLSGITQSSGLSTIELNDAFLAGCVLRYKPEPIVGCHQILTGELIRLL